jgi:hypothetical protein
MDEMPRLQTGPEKLGRPGLSGGLGKRSQGGIVNPSCNQKGKNGNPPPKAGAPEFYPNNESKPTGGLETKLRSGGRAPCFGAKAAWHGAG